MKREEKKSSRTTTHSAKDTKVLTKEKRSELINNLTEAGITLKNAVGLVDNTLTYLYLEGDSV
jgi:predicted transcriptional regulator YheO